jgi:hypothetical protein
MTAADESLLIGQNLFAKPAEAEPRRPHQRRDVVEKIGHGTGLLVLAVAFQCANFNQRTIQLNFRF